jgi:hypothetical protein
MKKRITVGTLFIILGLLISLGPSTIFAVCGPMDDGKFMKCHWTARAELGIGLGIVLLAVLSIVFASKEVRAGLLLGIATLSSNSILIPTALIGVCGGEHMQCNALTRPALLVIGVISIVIALVQTVILLRQKESE